MALFRICLSDDFEVHYDPERGMYRLSAFEDGHYKDEYWFDAYEEKELAVRNKAVDYGYLYDWFISSVGTEEPVWTEAHIEELLADFIVIPKGI